MTHNKLACLFLLLILPWFAVAKTPSPLPASEAFQLHVVPNQPEGLVATWTIAPGYYLYRDQFKAHIYEPYGATFAPIAFPPSKPLDPAIGLGPLPVYANHVSLPLNFVGSTPNQATVLLNYQGCSRYGFCYPPMAQKAHINLTTGAVTLTPIENPAPTTVAAPHNNADIFTTLLSHDHVFALFFSFLGFGLLLAFTPCVLPMLPILGSIIAGQKQLGLRRAFFLSLTYVLSMAVTFAIAGVAAGWLGQSLQSFFQNPWTIGLFSLIFVALALSLFGLYDLTLPTRFQSRINALSARQHGGSYWGVAVMGCLATLIASPCVSAPLVGTLGYISATGNAWTGGLALFALGLGMGIPLLIVGASGGKLLPKAGTWLQTIKNVCGILLLALALSFLDRIIPAALSLFLWGSFMMVLGVYIWALSTIRFRVLRQGIGLVVLLYGALMVTGAAMGHSNLLAPLRSLEVAAGTPSISTPSSVQFNVVSTLSGVENLMAQAASRKQPVFIDFYASWCLDCKLMDGTVFQDPAVIQALNPVMVIRADISANNAASRALQKHFKVFAPPTLIFIDGDGVEQARIIGSTNAITVQSHLSSTHTVAENPVDSGVSLGDAINIPQLGSRYAADPLPQKVANNG